jgi:pimeloyl-ACP methyl ester carboxylesterase
MTVPYLPGQDQPIFYTRQGGGEAIPILLIHGAGGTHLDWPAEIRRLPTTTVYTIDLPGHGKSAGLPRDRIAAYASDVVNMIHYLELEDIVVAGYSMGGAIALELGLWELPEISGLVLISTGARLRVHPQILELISKDFNQGVDLLASFYWTAKTPENVIQLSKERMLASNPESFRKDFIACNRFDRMGQCGYIVLPTLVISGGDDNLTPPKYSRFLADQLPNAKLVEIPGAGHMVFLEEANLVANEIHKFIGEIDQNN